MKAAAVRFALTCQVCLYLVVTSACSPKPQDGGDMADRPSPIRSVSYSYVGGAGQRVENVSSVGRGTSSGTYRVDQIGVLKIETTRRNGFRAPVIMTPGFGLAGHIYLTTVDGRPGWAYAFLEAGHDVYIVDRSHTTRTGFDVSSFNDVKAGTADPASQPTLILWLDERVWTRWGLGPEFGAAFADGQFPIDFIDQLVGSFAPVISENAPLRDQALGNVEGLTELLEKVGSAVVITHSASGADGFNVARDRPDLVTALVSIEPVGCSAELAAALLEVPTLSVFGDNFQVRKQMIPRFEHCKELASAIGLGGGRAELLHLPEQGIRGNSHIMMSDYNSDDIAQHILEWLDND